MGTTPYFRYRCVVGRGAEMCIHIKVSSHFFDDFCPCVNSGPGFMKNFLSTFHDMFAHASAQEH